MPRFAVPPPDPFSTEPRGVHEGIAGAPREALIGAIVSLVTEPELAERWHQFDALLSEGSVLAAHCRELAALVAARRWRCRMQWDVHEPQALAAGVPPAVIDAVRAGQPPEFATPASAAVYEYARELLDRGEVSDEVYAHVLARVGPPGVVELTAVIGYATMVAMMLGAHAHAWSVEPDAAEPSSPVPLPAARIAGAA